MYLIQNTEVTTVLLNFEVVVTTVLLEATFHGHGNFFTVSTLNRKKNTIHGYGKSVFYGNKKGNKYGKWGDLPYYGKSIR